MARIFSASARPTCADAARLALALEPRALGIGLGGHLDRLGLLARIGELRLALVLPDLDGERGGGDIGLLFRHRLLLAQRALLHGGDFLQLVGLDLLHRDLAIAQLGQDLLDAALRGLGARRADQHLLQFEAIGLKFAAHFVGRLPLDVAALLQELDQRLGLGDILEIGRDHRVERLLDQALDVAEPLHDQRRLHVVDMHDDRRAAAAARRRPW